MIDGLRRAPNPSPFQSISEDAQSAHASVGILVFDDVHRLLCWNAYAMQVLRYPNRSDHMALIETEIVPRVIKLRTTSEHAELFSWQLNSGRREYICRAFLLSAHGRFTNAPAASVSLQRRVTLQPGMPEFCRNLGITQRESVVLKLLTQGLTSKEIASQMSISPNTVKAFLRAIMLKMGVSTRSGVVGRLISAGVQVPGNLQI